MSFFAPTLNVVWNSLQDTGLDARKLFEKAGINPEVRHDITARISDQQTDELLWMAHCKSNDSAFAFKMAVHMQASCLGALGLAWLTSPSLRQAFERVARYSRAVSDAYKIRVEDSDDEVRIIFDHSTQVFRDPALRETLALASGVQLCRMTFGDAFSPARVHFQHTEPPEVSEYYKFFRCEMVFASEFNGLFIPAAMADQPLPGFNPQLLQQLDLMTIEYLASLDKNDIIGRTRAEIVRQLPSGRVSLERIAETLHMSRRSLTRRLREANESFKNLLATTRMELAEKYVLDKNLSLTEVSFLLGFSDTSSFSRAYKTWTGQSPSTYRESIQPSTS